MIKKLDGYFVLKILQLDECKHFITGNCMTHIGGNLYTELPYKLEIMKEEALDEDVYLLRLDENNEEINDTWHPSLQDALEQGLYEYNVQPEEWEDV